MLPVSRERLSWAGTVRVPYTQVCTRRMCPTGTAHKPTSPGVLLMCWMWLQLLQQCWQPQAWSKPCPGTLPSAAIRIAFQQYPFFVMPRRGAKCTWAEVQGTTDGAARHTRHHSCRVLGGCCTPAHGCGSAASMLCLAAESSSHSSLVSTGQHWSPPFLLLGVRGDLQTDQASYATQ